MATFDVDIKGVTYEVDAPDENTAWKWANVTHSKATKDYKSMSAPVPVDPTKDMGTGQRLAAGAGKAIYDIGRGIKQVAGLTEPGEIEQAREMDAPLMKTGAGATGNFLGNVADFVPTMMIPGANTMTGAGVAGAAMGALAPTVEGESRALNTGIGAVGGVGGKFIGDKVTGAVTGALANKQGAAATAISQNAPRDSVLQAAKVEGYVVPPSNINLSATNRVVDSIGGKAATAQAASSRNQEITNKLARRALGLNEGDALTEAALSGVRKTAGAAYENIKTLPGKFDADSIFQKEINALGSDFAAAAREFPEIASNAQVAELKTALTKNQISPDAAIEVIKKLRFDASKNFKSFDDPAKAALAKAQRGAADAVEGLVERNLIKQGNGKLVPEFRKARELIAKTHDVEAALLEGGNVSAKALAKALGSHPLTGDLGLIAKFAAQFEKAAQNPAQAQGAGVSNLLGMGGGAGLGALGWLASDNPAGAALGVLPFALPPAARGLALSKAYQNIMANPHYGPGLGLRAANSAVLSPMLAPALTLGGAGGAIGAAQDRKPPQKKEEPKRKPYQTALHGVRS